MTFQEKKAKLKEDRGNALISLASSQTERQNKLDETNFYYTYLFGSGGNNIGLITILELYYKELNISVGRTTTRPSLEGGEGTSTSAWKSSFDIAIRPQGDDANGFYPPDANNIGQKELNESSNYLTTNDDQRETNGGIIPFVVDGSNIDVAIGEEADTSTTKTSPDYGVGLIGQRTADNEQILNPAYVDEATTPGEPQYYYGDGSPDNPDYYNTPEKTDLENALQELIDKLNNYKTYVDGLIPKLQYIADGNHSVFEEAEMSADMPTNDITNLENLSTNIQGHIDNLQNELTYFSSFTAGNDISTQPGYNRADFDNRLNTIIPGILSNTETTIQNRVSDVETAIDYNDTAGSFRKWIVFWIKQIIGKFDGSLLALNGIDNEIIPNAKNSLGNANEALLVLVGTDYDKYLLTPEVIAGFFNPDLNEDTGEITKKNASVIWLANIAANRYNIYRKEVSNKTTLFDDTVQWGSADLIEEYAELNKKGIMVKSDYKDTASILENGGKFIYRIKSFDTNISPSAWSRLDTELAQNTSSQQSNTNGETFTIDSIENNVVTLTEEPENNFGLCFIENKYYGVLKQKKKKITLSEIVEGTPTELVEIKGGVFVP